MLFSQTVEIKIRIRIPDLLQKSLITPLLKKPKLYKTELSNYKPISHQPLIATILEKIVYKQLISTYIIFI